MRPHSVHTHIGAIAPTPHTSQTDSEQVHPSTHKFSRQYNRSHIFSAIAPRRALFPHTSVCVHTLLGAIAPTSHSPQIDSEQVHPSTHTFSRQYNRSHIFSAQAPRRPLFPHTCMYFTYTSRSKRLEVGRHAPTSHTRKQTQSKCILRRTHFPVNIIVHTHILGASDSKGAIPTHCVYIHFSAQAPRWRAPRAHITYLQTDSEKRASFDAHIFPSIYVCVHTHTLGAIASKSAIRRIRRRYSDAIYSHHILLGRWFRRCVRVCGCVRVCVWCVCVARSTRPHHIPALNPRTFSRQFNCSHRYSRCKRLKGRYAPTMILRFLRCNLINDKRKKKKKKKKKKK